MQVYYDLHLHSCLSPCGEDDMTPLNIVRMAMLAGLNMIAVTDHNSAGNVRAAVEAGREWGVCVVPGIEAMSREEGHVLCYFPEVEQAEAMQALLYARMPPIPNKPSLFGNQIYMDAGEGERGREERLLLSAADMDVAELAQACRELGGVAVPAHVDKQAYSLLNNLGFLPPDCGFTTVEVAGNVPPGLEGYRVIHSSDAHQLDMIPDAERFLDLDSLSPRALVRYLKQPL